MGSRVDDGPREGCSEGTADGFLNGFRVGESVGFSLWGVTCEGRSVAAVEGGSVRDVVGGSVGIGVIDLVGDELMKGGSDGGMLMLGLSDDSGELEGKAVVVGSTDGFAVRPGTGASDGTKEKGVLETGCSEIEGTGVLDG